VNRRRIARWLLLSFVSLVGVGVPVLLAPPAAACSCVAATPAEHLARADAVFLGTVTERRVPDSGSSAAPAVYVVEVSRVYKGRVAATQEVVTAVSGASCGLELPARGQALFFASRRPTADGDLRPGQLAGSLCDGTRAGAGMPAAFGAGTAPGNVPGAGPSDVPGSLPPAGSGVPGLPPAGSSDVPGSLPPAGSGVPGLPPAGSSAVPGGVPTASSPPGDDGLPPAALGGLAVAAAALLAAGLLRFRRRTAG
jgi:hypothetical protein